MEPLPFRSGMQRDRCVGRRPTQGFNGAAPFQERNDATSGQSIVDIG